VALDELVVDGLVTNLAIHRAMLSNETFVKGLVTTNMLDRLGSQAFLAAAVNARAADRPSLVETVTIGASRG
jgi:acetyl/propionyl-CoA carboxylase alpha subunit